MRRTDQGRSKSLKPACQCQSMLDSLPTRNVLAKRANPNRSNARAAAREQRRAYAVPRMERADEDPRQVRQALGACDCQARR